jgi:hypothetical protein
MKSLPIILALAASTALSSAAEKQLFNGKDLTGWKGQAEFWSVKDGAITGESTQATPVKENTFLIWEDGEVGDFELHFKYKFGVAGDYGNSGMQYRSKVVKPEYSVVSGYQADCEVGKAYSGILYEEKGRGILAKRGQKVVLREGAAPNKPKIEVDYVVIAKGNHLQHFINGKLTVDVTDETAIGAKTGVLAIQLHAGKPMIVQVKDIVLKTDK